MGAMLALRCVGVVGYDAANFVVGGMSSDLSTDGMWSRWEWQCSTKDPKRWP